jgi:PilZ domain
MPYQLTTMRSTRTEIRFPLEASVEFWWKDMSGATRHGLGRSRDISEHGVFVLAEQCPPQGDPVELSILIDELSQTGELLQVHINGKVLRVDEILAEKEGSGFAVLSVQPLSDTGSTRLN